MTSAFHKRSLLLCSFLVIGLSLLSWRLVHIQLVDRQRYADSSLRAFQRVEQLPAMRGMIVDRREEPLAKSIPVSTLFVDKTHLRDPNVVSYGLAYLEASADEMWLTLDDQARQRRLRALRAEILDRDDKQEIVDKHFEYAVGILARPLGIKRDELRARIESSRGVWVPIVKDMPDDVAVDVRKIIDTNWLQGFAFQNSIKRWYTTPNRATHLIGYTGEVEVTDEMGKPQRKVLGRFGIEKVMEEFLAGRDGWREHQRDARGLLVPGDESMLMPPRAGLNVQLTIDMGLQSIIEEELEWGLEEFESKQGAVVMMDPKTGEVLAMASRPHFDLNSRLNILENGYNYALQAVYEPGSTIKVVAASGALNEGLVSPTTPVNCHGGYFQNGKVVVRDAHPAGTLPFTKILTKSNNIGTYRLGLMLGQSRFYDYLGKYGFGKKTGIQLSGESAGMARNTGNEVDFSRATFGYATSVTPLQLACAYSAIASDGNLRKPLIVKSLIANDGTVVEDYHAQITQRVLKEATAKQMREALKTVTETGGTAIRAAVPGFEVAGKTGTVHKYNPRGGYFDHKFIVSFVGMMPAEEPAFVCLVVIDDPRTDKCNIYGGTIAGPVFNRIATRAASYMNLQPTKPVPVDVASTSEP